MTVMSWVPSHDYSFYWHEDMKTQVCPWSTKVRIQTEAEIRLAGQTSQFAGRVAWLHPHHTESQLGPLHYMYFWLRKELKVPECMMQCQCMSHFSFSKACPYRLQVCSLLYKFHLFISFWFSCSLLQWFNYQHSFWISKQKTFIVLFVAYDSKYFYGGNI